MTPAAGGPATPPLVGRAEELAVIEQLLRPVLQGGAQAAVIDGEAGIGKTRLLDEAVRLANEFGFEVLRGHAEQLEVGRPFGAFVDALAVGGSSDPERARLGELLHGPTTPAVSGSGVPGDRPGNLYALVEEILAQVERLAARGPLALVLEDLHWADDGTLMTLHAIHRRLKNVPIALLLSVRPGAFSPALNRLLDLMASENSTQIALGPLDDDAVAELVEAVLGAPPSRAIRKQVDAAAGNPLYIVELVGALVEEGAAIGVETAGVEARPAALPPSLRLTILRRLSALASDALEVLRLASILGPSFELSHLQALLGRSTIELLPALDIGLRAGLLMQSGDRLGFRHDLIRTAIYEDLAPAIRAGLHVDAARALAASGATPIDIAEHFTLGASRGDREAVEWILRAARESLERAPAVTVRLLDRVLAIMEVDDPARDRILAEKVLALTWAGQDQDDFREAERLAREVLARAHDPVTESMIRLALLTSLLIQGRPVDAEIESKAAAGRSEISGRLRPQLRAAGAFATILLGRLDAAWAAAEESLLEGERLGDELAQCMARCVQSHVAILQARPADAVALADEALRLSSARARWFHAHFFLGWALLEFDRFEEAEQAFRTGRALSERFGTLWNLGTYAWGVVWLRFSSGEWDDAIAEGETGVTSYREQSAGIAWLYAPLAIIAVQRNEFGRAEDLIAAAQTDMENRRLDFTRYWVLIPRAFLAEARGDASGAQAALAEAWEMCVSQGLAFLFPRLGPDLVRLSLAGNEGYARTVAGQVEATAERMGSPSATAAALRSRGLVEGDPDPLLAAVAVSEDSPRPFERARTLEDAAATLARAGRISEAVPLFQESLGIYGRLGALHPEARVLAALRSLGVRPGRRGSRKRPTSGLEALTDTEKKVARLIADGLTYREVGAQLFISPRTVETHVSHALAKLGCHSRRELRQAVQTLVPS